MAIQLNNDKILVSEIMKRLERNKKIYGKQFCPCVIPTKYISENSSDYICMCKEFREMEEGTCHCGLYIKRK